MAKLQADMYVGAKSGNVKGFDQEAGPHTAQGVGVGVKAGPKASGPRVDLPGKGPQNDEHLFRGLTRGTDAPIPFQNPSGVGSGSGHEVMDIIREGGKGPMEADYRAPKIGRSLAGEHSGDPSRN